ncbi:MAG: molybdopterin cofactor-binding domain-containing protein [Xanthobacteraceae bacterium]
MARKRGRGVAAVNYPTGMNLGGDPTQALVHSTPTGNFIVSLSSVDLGQGMKSIMAQICAETLGVPTERVIVDTADSDTGPHCMGTFASRGTHRAGNAVIAAAKEARDVMLEVAANMLEVDSRDLRTDGTGNIHIVGVPSKSVSVTDVALAAHFQQGRSISGRGMFFIPRSYPSPTDGAMKPSTCYAHACTIAEVEVDTETGEVDVLSLKSVYEVGRALNPKMVEQQLVGGTWMGMSHALYETTEPYYPARDHGARDFNEYLMLGLGDLPKTEIRIIERPAPDGPYGAKGLGEMCANAPIPAIANAIFDAVGVRVDSLPLSPEKILRALLARGSSAAA